MRSGSTPSRPRSTVTPVAVISRPLTVNETSGMAGHRNRLVNNLIENNGTEREAAGIRVRGETTGLVFEGNTIRDTRPEGQRRQVVGICIDATVGEVEMKGNRIEAELAVKDGRR